MLTRIIAIIAAMGLIALVAALPALAQSGDDSSGAGAAAPTATPTATATPAPGPTSFAITPAVGALKPRALTRLGDKWYVAGWGSHGTHGRVHVFSNNGTFEKRLGLETVFQGLTHDGTNLIAVTGGAPRIYTWNPSTDSLVSSKTTSLGNKYRAKGIAHDGTDTWIAAFQPQTGTADLLKLHGTTSTLYRVNAAVDSLTHVESLTPDNDGFLYATLRGADNPDLLRIEIDDLTPHTATLDPPGTPMNNWKVVKRNAGLDRGLVFHDDGTAYGFNADLDEVRQARQPSPERLFALTPDIGNQQTRSLTRMGSKWYVGGHSAGGYIHIFNDDGSPSSPGSIKTTGPQMPTIARGLTSVGSDLAAISGGQPRVYKWTPQSDSTTEIAVPNAFRALNLPNYAGQGLAYDGTNVWATLQPRANAQGSASLLIKLNAATLAPISTYRINLAVDSLAYENGYLYGVLDDPAKKHLVRISLSALNAASTNYWKVERRDVGIRDGLVFRNGVAHGFNEAQDEIRKARQPSPERLFALTPSIGDQLPHGIARVGDKWHVAGHSGDGYVSIFSNTGTYERRIKAPDATIRGLASDGTNLFAAANSTANAISVADNSSVAVYVPKIYKWTPQANETATASATTFCIPNSLGYTPNGVAYDAGGTHIWVALDSPTRNILVKLNATTGAHVGTYQMNNPVSGLTYKNGNLYGLSDGNIVMAVASHLKTSPATWVNNWEVVKRDSGLSNGLVFRDRTAYGFNAAQDEVRAESGSPTIAAAPASPAGVASPTGSIPPTGADPSNAAAPAPNPATPSGDADASG